MRNWSQCSCDQSERRRGLYVTWSVQTVGRVTWGGGRLFSQDPTRAGRAQGKMTGMVCRKKKASSSCDVTSQLQSTLIDVSSLSLTVRSIF